MPDNRDVIEYKDLELLNSKTRCCMADTMAFVDLYRDFLDALDGITTALNNRTVIVIKEVIEESFDKCTEIGCTAYTLNDFEHTMLEKIHESKMPTVLDRLLKTILNEAAYPDKLVAILVLSGLKTLIRFRIIGID